MITVLALADWPPRTPIKEIVSNNNIDLIITLGDLEYSDISQLEAITDIPKIGVYGNHCTPGYMTELGIINAHLAVTTLCGVRIGGFEGSHRYKTHPYAKMYYQDEVTKLMKDFSPVDIFIAHSPPRGIHDEPDDIHCGFDALREYIERAKPRHFFHGHTYPRKDQLVPSLGDTKIVYVSGDMLFNLDF